jgi:hypothetical protein
MHIQYIVPARIDESLHHEPGEATPTIFIKGEDTVDFVTIGMQPAPGHCSKCTIDKGTENAVFFRVGLLLVVVIPDFLDEGEFSMGKLTGEGGC